MQTLFTLLRDPIWQSILGIAAIFVTWITYRYSQGKKTLFCGVYQRTSLLKTEASIRNRIRVAFDEKPVEELGLISLLIENTGNTPITSKDYEQDLCFTFDNDTQILQAWVSDAQPPELQPTIQTQPNSVRIHPTLLNSGDKFFIQIIVNRQNPKLVVRGRLVGVKRIQLGSKPNGKDEADYTFLRLGTGIYSSIVILVLVRNMETGFYTTSQVYGTLIPLLLLMVSLSSDRAAKLAANPNPKIMGMWMIGWIILFLLIFLLVRYVFTL